MSATVSQVVSLKIRRVSVVPSIFVLWTTAIILCGYKTGVQGDCQIVCADNSYCSACIGTPELCTTDPFAETTDVGTSLFTVTVDPPENSTIRILDGTGDPHPMFRFYGLEVFLNNSLDYESVKEYYFTIDCFDEDGWSEGSDSLDHILEVLDENDEIPYFDQSIIFTSIEENADPGTELITIRASDLDDNDDILTYSIVELDVPFNVTAGCIEEAFLTLVGTVDFEEQENYTVTVVATDGCRENLLPLDERNEVNVTVIVLVNDLDDESPVFNEDSYEVDIRERNITFVYRNISAYDPDSFDAPLQYSFVGQSGNWGCLDYLRIDQETAEVTVKKELDYESSLEPCIITVKVVQEDNCMMTANTTLTVIVTDVNECPTFTSDSFSGQLTIDDPFVIVDGGSERLIIGMTDDDLEFNGNYSIKSNEAIELVEIQGSGNSRTRSFYVKFIDPSLVMSVTEIQISLSDETTGVVCDVATTNITVQLIEDSLAPNFTKINYQGNVLENATEGTEVLQVAALNSDQTIEGVVYRLQMASDGGEYVFDIDAESGAISVAVNNSIDAESVKQYILIVEAVDERGTYYRSSITSVIIEVTDVNESPPMFTQGVFENDIEEEVPIGFPIRTVQAIDSDVDAVFEYSIRESDDPFQIDPVTGMINASERLDRDDGTTMYNITVKVTDGRNEDECRVVITLTDINDNAPVFMGGPVEAFVSENSTDVEIIELEATDIDDGDNAEVVYVLESPEGEVFSVDNETGMVFANGPFDYESVKEYTLVIKASDPNFSTLTTVTVKITDVNDNAPMITNPCSYIEVFEDADVEDVICTVVAEDPDEDGTDAITYSLDPSIDDVPFIVNDTGEIRAKKGLDREADDNYTIIVIAEDSGQPPLSSNTTITVIVLDINDNEPVFDVTDISIRLQADEIANPPVLLQSVKPTDADLPPWDIIQCEKNGGEESFVVLTGQDGSCDIYAYETLPTSSDPYTVSFYAFNPDNRALRSQNVTLSVDIRDNVCYVDFVNETNYDVIVLQSELESSSPVVTLEITSNCNSDDVLYEELRQTYQSDMDGDAQSSQNFTVNEQTGDILPNDIVMEGEHVLLVSAYNQSDSGVNETTTVRIIVTGVLNRPPVFSKDNYTATITNDSMVLVIDLGPQVTDDDYPSFATGEVIFSEVSEIDKGSDKTTEYFTVDPDGKVRTSSNDLNEIKIGTFELVVMAIDGAIDPLNDTADVVIKVDVDQTIPIVVPPMITKNCDDTVEIEEEIDPPTHICDIDASSSYDDQIIFGLDSFSDHFTIDENSGEINGTRKFDYETDERMYTLLVYAEGATSKLRSYTSITVIIVDVNDNPPEFSQSQFYFSMEEDRHESNDCMTFLGLIESTDADSEINQNVMYTTDNDDFQVLGNNLTAVECIRRNDVDFSSGMVEVLITALNIGFKGNHTADVVAVINVEDLNDFAPQFVNDPEDFTVIVENLAAGPSVLFKANGSDGDAGPYNNKFVFSLAEDQEDVIYSLFKMSSDGELTVRDVSISDLADKYEVIVMVTDMGQPPLNSTRTITVFVGIDVTKPYFPLDERNQTIEISENAQICQSFPAPELCNSTDGEVQYELDVDPKAGSNFFSISETGTTPALCISELDREVSPSYTVTLTASYTNSTLCNPTDGTTRKRRAIEEVESNTIVFTIIVNDVIDSPPSLQFPGNRTDHAYYLAAIDSTQFGSDVFTLTATDADATSKFSYILKGLSDQTFDGPRNTILIDENTGRITTNSLLYPWLSDAGSWEWDDAESNFIWSRTEDRYNVTVCDVIDEQAPPSCDEAPLTFKILLSFEHIIIHFNTPPASIVPQQNTIIRCIAEKMDPTNNIELYLQFLSPVSEGNDPSLEKTATDMWLYGVDTSKLPSSPYLKFDDFQSIWEYTDGIQECSNVEMTPMRLRLSKQLNVSSKTTTSMEAWVLVALGIIVFIGNLICIILLLVSWRKMLEDGGKHIARELTVKEGNLEEKLEKGIVNPVFQMDNEEDDEMDIMATEADEDAAGSEEPLITTVYLTDGKTQSTIAMASDDEPTNVTTAVGTDDAALLLPPPPTSREYDSAEEILDVYPFDEPEEGFKFKDDEQSGQEETDAAPNVHHDYATVPEVESSTADATLPPVDYETETKYKDGSEKKDKKMEADPSVGASDSGVEPDDPHYDYEYPTPPAPAVTETRPLIESPVDDKTEDIPLLPPPGVKPVDPHYDYKYPPRPAPAAQDTRPVIESPVDDKTEDLPLPPPPPPILPPIVPPIDYAEGKTVTFGGETVVGEGAGDGGSTTTDQDTASESSARSSATEDTNRTPTKSLSDASFTAELKRAVASMKAGKGIQPVSPQSGGESDGESIGYLDDESVISANEIMGTGL